MIQTDLHGLRGPMCKICFKPFASLQTLARHIEVQHIDSGVPYPCHYCEKIFRNKSHRSVHVHREHRAEHREYLDSKQQHNLTNLPPNWPSKAIWKVFSLHKYKETATQWLHSEISRKKNQKLRYINLFADILSRRARLQFIEEHVLFNSETNKYKCGLCYKGGLILKGI